MLVCVYHFENCFKISNQSEFAISGIIVNASNDSSISVCMYIMYIWIHMWQEKNFYVPTTSPVRHHRCENANIIIIMISIPYCFSMAI